MRRDEVRLADIIEAADDITTFLAGVDEDRFRGDAMLQSAVLHKLTVIGEAAAGLSDEFRARNAGIP